MLDESNLFLINCYCRGFVNTASYIGWREVGKCFDGVPKDSIIDDTDYLDTLVADIGSNFSDLSFLLFVFDCGVLYCKSKELVNDLSLIGISLLFFVLSDFMSICGFILSFFKDVLFLIGIKMFFLTSLFFKSFSFIWVSSKLLSVY